MKPTQNASTCSSSGQIASTATWRGSESPASRPLRATSGTARWLASKLAPGFDIARREA